MRHRKHTFKLGRTTSHRRCMIANMLKSLIENGRIETSVAKAKELRRHAERMITCAKKNSLASKRQVIAKLMVSFNSLTSKEARAVKSADKKDLYNTDRRVVDILFSDLGTRFANRNGGYTRILRTGTSIGDSSDRCIIEFLAE